MIVYPTVYTSSIESTIKNLHMHRRAGLQIPLYTFWWIRLLLYPIHLQTNIFNGKYNKALLQNAVTMSTSYAKAQNLAKFVGLSILYFSTVMNFIKCSNSQTSLISSGQRMDVSLIELFGELTNPLNWPKDCPNQWIHYECQLCGKYQFNLSSVDTK